MSQPIPVTRDQIRDILNDPSRRMMEHLARSAREIKEQYFGRTISLYAPLYLSNYCSSHCTYCGFKSKNRIQRFKLTPEQIRREMSFLAGQGIENILLLTGESYKITPLSYLLQTVDIAREFFPSISLEVHPMDGEDYKELFVRGADGITVYQETYDRAIYSEVHLTGLKSDYDYRCHTPARAAGAGMRSVSMGILLGLADISEDLFDLYSHLRAMEKQFPGVEYSLSFPRLKPVKGDSFSTGSVDDITLTKVICLTRILFPRVGINLSTREPVLLRDHLLELGVTRMSAGSNTSVGGYTLKSADEQEPQFDIEDPRPVDSIIRMLKEKNLDPVLTDWRRISNG